MPILIPLGDLLGVSRQTTILAYQYGAGPCELVSGDRRRRLPRSPMTVPESFCPTAGQRTRDSGS